MKPMLAKTMPVKARLTPKQRVLEKHPKARECITWLNDSIFIVIGLNTIIGQGKTGRAAWADAARKL